MATKARWFVKKGALRIMAENKAHAEFLARRYDGIVKRERVNTWAGMTNRAPAILDTLGA